jgi:hypothetical protein
MEAVISLTYNQVLSLVKQLPQKQKIKLTRELENSTVYTDGIVPPGRKGSLTEGFGFWGNDVPFDETNYRDQLWQTGKNVW